MVALPELALRKAEEGSRDDSGDGSRLLKPKSWTAPSSPLTSESLPLFGDGESDAAWLRAAGSFADADAGRRASCSAAVHASCRQARRSALRLPALGEAAAVRSSSSSSDAEREVAGDSTRWRG